MEVTETKKKKKLTEKASQIPQRRNYPLQDFNGVCRNTNSKSKNKIKGSTLSSSSSSTSSSTTISFEAPKGCFHFHPYSSSKLKCSTKNTTTTTNAAANSTRPRSIRPTKENDFSRPISQTTKRNQSFLRQLQNGKRPISRNAQRSNLSDGLASGSEKFGEDLKKKEPKCGSGEPVEVFRFGNPLNTVENTTPVNKLSRWCTLNPENVVEKHVGEYSNGDSNGSAVKTPPMEASVSPEIQCGSSALLISGATPFCYSARHVLSDKRKCRSRGILTVGGNDDSLGSVKDGIFNDDRNSNHRRRESRPSFVPLPAAASIRWLSPCDEVDESKRTGSPDKYKKLVGSPEVDDIASSPSMCRVSMSDLLCDSGDSSVSDFRHSPKRFPDLECTLGLSSGKSQFEFPRSTSSCKAVLSQAKKRYHNSPGEMISPLSIGSLSGGNVIQTPESDSSSGKPAGPSCLKVKEDQGQSLNFELDSLTEILGCANLSSPRSQIPIWDPLGLGSQLTDSCSPLRSVDLPQIRKNSDNMASWNSDMSLDNVSQSQMRISWREGQTSRAFGMDELDCCRCLSGEEDTTTGSANEQKILQHGQSLDRGIEAPEYVEQEASIFIKRKEKLCPSEPGAFAESISVDGGRPDASGDSDWGLSYKNQLFRA